MLFTVQIENVQPGMVLDFSDMIAERAGETIPNFGEAEVISVEEPDGLGDYFGIWAMSEEDGSEVYVQAHAAQSFAIVG
jgi:hypothetical protein